MYNLPAMMLRSHPHLKGILLSLSAFSLFALGDAGYKFISPHYSPFILLFYGSLFIVLILLAASPRLGGVRAVRASRHLKFHALRGIVLFFQALLFIVGLSAMSMAKAYALVFIAPFIAGILATLFLKEKASTAQWLATAAGFAGVLIVLRPGAMPLDLASLAVLASAFLFSVSNIIARRIGDGDALLTWGLAPELSYLACAALAVIPVFEIPEAVHLIILFFIAASSAIALICLSLAFVHAPAHIAAPFHYVQMLWGIAFGYIIFGDTLDIWTAAGAAVIVASGIWLIRGSHK